MSKKYAIFIVIILLTSTFYLSNQEIVKANSPGNTTVDIYIAVHNNDPILQVGNAKYFFPILDNYNWTVGNITYIFHTTETGMDELGEIDG